MVKLLEILGLKDKHKLLIILNEKVSNGVDEILCIWIAGLCFYWAWGVWFCG